MNRTFPPYVRARSVARVSTAAAWSFRLTMYRSGMAPDMPAPRTAPSRGLALAGPAPMVAATVAMAAAALMATVRRRRGLCGYELRKAEHSVRSITVTGHHRVERFTYENAR
ncbi:hypothetical protein GCM10027290_60880 [Micromonospora sonneratiae]